MPFGSRLSLTKPSGLFVAGLKLDAPAGGGSLTTDLAFVEPSVTPHTILWGEGATQPPWATDAAIFESNQYSFGLFTYVQRDIATGQEFEVVNYWVE